MQWSAVIVDGCLVRYSGRSAGFVEEYDLFHREPFCL